ncbi:Rieske 2Fe-2S domain-containing protein [Halobacteria archaeon AArc-m2/3/4]|uniref:Rieske 2Fe-2S domain-containing protein n=1 Tax=Natronoglomus mannanivorans TaxID=2979990 RepID=A0AAP2YYB8_9EURY|nr:Rieske 2Fe-2S domain-containing protein [Halobacteria archaeon AArc-xg1-1]MCU4974566.1 Rieske 2Fe-2S domain-containing protein [Halobacteria archaeon AArc-m2/3/4]
MANDDNYPVESDRRRFVKGVVGGAALSGLLTVGAVSVTLTTTPSGGGGGTMDYRGAARELGPAPRGLPQIPIEIDDDGYVQGMWPEPETVEEGGVEFEVSQTEFEVDGETVTYSTEWFQYCGLQTFDGIRPDADQDAYLRYDEAVPTNDYPWMENISPGSQIHVDDFEDYEDWGNDVGDAGIGQPATATWRSQDVPPEQKIPVLLIRSEEIEAMAEEDEWIAQTCPEGFVAFINKCTHFCCVPGYKRLGESANYDAENKIYCNCHQSVYNPFNIIEERFVSLPRPEDD